MTGADRQIAALDRILHLVVVLNDDMAQRMTLDGLTVSRAHLLWELRQRGPTTQRTLADALKVSARTVTGLIDGLVATGFVTREPHPTDRRATHVTFTEHGARVIEAMGRDQQQFAEALFGGVPQDRFDCFVAGLDEILTRLQELGIPPQTREGDQ